MKAPYNFLVLYLAISWVESSPAPGVKFPDFLAPIRNMFGSSKYQNSGSQSQGGHPQPFIGYMKGSDLSLAGSETNKGKQNGKYPQNYYVVESGQNDDHFRPFYPNEFQQDPSSAPGHYPQQHHQPQQPQYFGGGGGPPRFQRFTMPNGRPNIAYHRRPTRQHEGGNGNTYDDFQFQPFGQGGGGGGGSESNFGGPNFGPSFGQFPSEHGQSGQEGSRYPPPGHGNGQEYQQTKSTPQVGFFPQHQHQQQPNYDYPNLPSHYPSNNNNEPDIITLDDIRSNGGGGGGGGGSRGYESEDYGNGGGEGGGGHHLGGGGGGPQIQAHSSTPYPERNIIYRSNPLRTSTRPFGMAHNDYNHEHSHPHSHHSKNQKYIYRPIQEGGGGQSSDEIYYGKPLMMSASNNYPENPNSSPRIHERKYRKGLLLKPRKPVPLNSPVQVAQSSNIKETPFSHKNYDPEPAATGHHGGQGGYGEPAEFSGNGDRIHYHQAGHEGPYSYRFGYDTGKGANRMFRFEEQGGKGDLKGKYGFYDKYGKLNVIAYKSDPVHGFSAQREKH